ncbi:MAG: FkbM family methyltransferase [Planctomycetota bacterium]|jgi:FkbM family methyltransferase
MSNADFYKKHMRGSAQCPPLPQILFDTFGEKDDGTFVEVGAFNGINWSATNCLARLGWRGLMFEPHVDFFNDCNRFYGHNKKVVVERCAILDFIGKTKLYIGGSLSTTSAERVEVYQDIWWSKSSNLKLDKYKEVAVYTLDHMLEKHKIHPNFEFLVIDVEGAEAQVLNGLSFDKWHPSLMMIETHEDYDDERLSKTAGEVVEIISEHGYKKVYSNYINTVYRRERENE